MTEEKREVRHDGLENKSSQSFAGLSSDTVSWGKLCLFSTAIVPHTSPIIALLVFVYEVRFKVFLLAFVFYQNQHISVSDIS